MIRIQTLKKGRTESWKFDGHAERDHVCEEVQESKSGRRETKWTDL